MIRPAALLGWLTVALAVAGCGGGKGATDKNGVGSKPPQAQLKDLKKTELVVGKGAEAATGDRLYVRYIGRLRNGSIIDSNTKEGSQPYTFVLGLRQVVPGWDQGLVGMKVGGQRKLEIPYMLAYGDYSPNERIPAKADLFFEIELLDIVIIGEENFFDTSEMNVGGGTVAGRSSTVVVDYVTKLVNGKEVDSSYKRGKPVQFKVGASEALPGVDAGVVGMRVGGKRKLRLPPALAYGQFGTPQIPANSILIVELELKQVK